MKLIDDWKWRAPRLTSVQLSLLASVFAAIEMSMPYIAPENPNRWFALASIVVSIGAAVARIIAQPKARRDPAKIKK